MKVSHIAIKDWQQFKSLELDLTYPAGHSKAGQPLDKVCLIGQSGTGKTTLLRLLHEFYKADPHLQKFPHDLFNVRPQPRGIEDYNNLLAFEEVDEHGNLPTTDISELEKIQSYSGPFIYEGEGEKKSALGQLQMKFNSRHNPSRLVHMAKEKINAQVSIDLSIDLQELNKNEVLECLVSGSPLVFGHNLVYFPAELTGLYYDMKLPTFRAMLATAEKEKQEVDAINRKRYERLSKQGKPIKFTREEATSVWLGIYQKVISYREAELFFVKDLTSRAEKEEINLREHLKTWKQEHSNPLHFFAEKVDDLLQRFHLKLNQEYEDIDSISTLSCLNNEKKVIPFDDLSTGTRQLLLTGFTLFGLNPTHSMVMIDEPETSLYPDMQRDMVKYYTSFGENNQFFLATHSPIIASQFEPWEVIELDFDAEGYVQQKQYYTGERHVDNYTTDPRLLRWDDLLHQLFDVAQEGNPLRHEKIDRFYWLQHRVKEIAEQGKPGSPEQEKYWKEYIALANKLNWEVSTNGKPNA